MTTVRIELPYLPPAEFSRNSRCHWHKLHAVQRQVNNDVLALLLESGQKPACLWKAARLTYTFFLPDKRRRDGDNLVTASKPITDALVGVVLEDDSLTVIGLPEYRFQQRKGKPGTLIEVEAA